MAFQENRPNEQISNIPVTIQEKLKDIENQSKEESKDKKVIFLFSKDQNSVRLGFINRTEAFYARSAQLLSSNPLDQVVYAQYTIDSFLSSKLNNWGKSLIVVRHKSRWGNDTVEQTSFNPLRLADAVAGNHAHFLGKEIIWLREGWIDLSLNDIFCFDAKNKHYLTLGAFSFRLGRGIALGDAYVVDGTLGFYSSNVIDQFAPGILAHGDIKKDKLTYEIYLGVLDNFIDSFEDVNEEIYAMQIGRKRCPQRGFGKLNYVLACDLNFQLLNKKKNNRSFTFNPYVMYNFDPELRAEFSADTNSKLITCGYAMEYIGPKWEFGFDFAQNFGRQFVKAWDRNRILVRTNENTAALTLVYSGVSEIVPNGRDLAPVTNINKKIVNNSVQSVCENGQDISFNPPLVNNIARFRPSHTNFFLGFMFVADTSYKLNDKTSLSATFGFASGDESTNILLNELGEVEGDQDYRGFISIQELYSGTRVPSFFLVGTNRLIRPLSFAGFVPLLEFIFPAQLLTFTNIKYFGIGAELKPNVCKKQFRIRPNYLAYWQEFPSQSFDPNAFIEEQSLASNYLGSEINLFMDVEISPNLLAFFVGGIFFPGQHFIDITGVPLNNVQINAVIENNPNSTPLVGSHYSLVLNWGFEYKF